MLKFRLDAVLSHVQSSSDVCVFVISRLMCRSYVLLYGVQFGCYFLRFSLLSKIIMEAQVF
jgi:hypothetical protein